MKWLSFSVITLLSAPASAAHVEVLHWWTSGGEASAVDVLKAKWTAQGNQWDEF
ncbi:MAG: sugar ABC transporter substrate-binding protein, partial [Aeromonas sp.]